jgi:hypothetical protein|tara:strand:+ start:257 stop:370 length:114 start_codon:yes stop_codon:yes gene_type:complete
MKDKLEKSSDNAAEDCATVTMEYWAKKEKNLRKTKKK